VVLSRGPEQRLEVDPRTLDLLADRSIEVHVVETGEAVKIYNELVDAGRAVGAVVHFTC
jgi:hypothetical protein